MQCPVYYPYRKGHLHVLPPWVGSLKNYSTSQSPQHQLYNLGYDPRIAPMDGSLNLFHGKEVN